MSETPHISGAGTEDFARRFRLLMAWHDLTLREIASATHNALSTVGTWKNGRVPASPATLQRLADIFHVPVEFLLTGLVASSGPVADNPASRILADLDLLTRALDGEKSQRTKQARPHPST
jgi:transcriptional regulator with XRE-family HTH domain